MEFKSQIATTREQSEQLLALGLKPETADMYLEKCMLPEAGNYYLHSLTRDIDPEHWFAARMNRDIIPAWSLSRLLEMMPLFFRKVIHIQIMPPVVSYWDAGLREFARVYDSSDIFENIISMIAWLISNGYFNTEYLKRRNKMNLLIDETPLQRIIRKTGRKPVQCKCRLCKQQCHTPCLGTPQDILKLIEAGYKDRLAPTQWLVGIIMGVTEMSVPMV